MKIYVFLACLTLITVSSMAGQNDHEKKLLERLLEKQTLSEVRDTVRMVQPMIERLYKWKEFDKASFEDLQSLLQKVLDARSLEEAKFLIAEHNQMHLLKELTDSDSELEPESETEDLDKLSESDEEDSIDLDAVVREEDLAAQQKPVIEPEERLHEVKIPKSRPRSMRVISSKLHEELAPRSSNLLYHKWKSAVKPTGRPSSLPTLPSGQEDY